MNLFFCIPLIPLSNINLKNIGQMENILHIQTITKQEFISIIESIVDSKISSQKESDKPKNLTVQSCAKILSVTELSIYSYIKKGFIPAKKIGRKYIIDRIVFENCMKEVKSLKYRR
jgi:excisionase family DNA binding protein